MRRVFIVVATRPKSTGLLLLAALLAQGLACSQETRNFGGSGGGNGGGGNGGDGGGGALVEDCLNGDDDDQDGKRDCDDEDCSPDFECVAPAPEGWIGPVALYKGPSAEAPACPAELPDSIYKGYADLANEPAQCGPCACGEAGVNVFCSLSQIEAYEEPLCVGPKNTSGQNGSVDECSSKAGANLATSFRAQLPQVNAFGACTPSQVEATLPPPSWASVAVACSRSELGKGCGSQLCAPRGKAPFEAALCLVREGDHECPAPYLTRRTFTKEPTDVTDTRGCEPCKCGSPKGSCSAVTTLYDGFNCSGASVVVPNDGSCVASGGFDVSSLMVEVTKEASCAPAGGAPAGSIAPANTAVTTVCCLPDAGMSP